LQALVADRRANQITWKQDIIAEVPLQRFTGYVGAVEVGYVEYDGGKPLGSMAEAA
jgi:hypothetical protein